MRLSLATNWREELLEGIEEYPVDNLFASLDVDILGGGRPTFTLPKVKKGFVEKYIEEIHSKGLKFNYITGGSCMGNREYNAGSHRKLLEHLKWLDDIGIDYATVCIPYMIELIKEQFPRIKVIASVIAHINTPNRARYYESLGADVLCLDYMINRDFNTLRAIREAVNCELELLVNDNCIYQCPYRYYHYNCCSHSSQPKMDGGFLDYSIWKCNWDKLNDLSHLVRAPWIRPEDIQEYEAIGIDMFKISGREFPTSRLKRALEAYASRKYEGNLLDLQSCILFSLDAPLGEMDVKTRQTRLMGLASHMPMVSSKLENLPQLDIKLDNTALDGFIDFFKEGKCTSLCHKCGYCQSWTEKALTCDAQSVEFYREALGKLVKNLTTSNFLKYSKYITIAQKLIRV